MATGYLRRAHVIVAQSGDGLSFRFWTGPKEARVPDDLTGYSVEATLTQANVANPTPIVLSTAAGSIVIAINIVCLTLPRALTAGWALGDYDFALRVWAPGSTVDRYVILSRAGDSRMKVVQGVTA